ncbi:MAG: hypothetical protein ABGW77_05145 [Campylobacterales bacterium]
MKGFGTKIGVGIGGLLLLLSPVAGKGVKNILRSKKRRWNRW